MDWFSDDRLAVLRQVDIELILDVGIGNVHLPRL
jgi:hypothetical protein